MEFKIIIDTQNPLFNRREIEGEVVAEVTPSRAEVAQMLVKKFSVDIGAIKIRTIKGTFGSKIFIVIANIYKSKEDKDKIEAKSKRDAKQEVKTEVLINEESPKEEVVEEKQEIKKEKSIETDKPDETPEKTDIKKYVAPKPSEDSSLTTSNKSNKPKASEQIKGEPIEEKKE